MAARALLIGLWLREMILAVTSVTPATSRTARTEEPATRPRPGEGRISTTDAQYFEPMLCLIELVFVRSSVIIFFLACRDAFSIASWVSIAFPRPTPTRPFLSPSTIQTEKLKRRPPAMTRATRRMPSIFCANSERGALESRRGPRGPRPPPPRRSPARQRPGRSGCGRSWMTLASVAAVACDSATGVVSSAIRLEIESRFTRCICKRLDSAEVLESAAIEDDFLHTLLAGELRERCCCSFRLLARGPPLRVGRGDCGERLAGIVVDDLRDDARVRLVDGKARALRRSDDGRTDA